MGRLIIGVTVFIIYLTLVGGHALGADKFHKIDSKFPGQTVTKCTCVFTEKGPKPCKTKKRRK